MKTVTGTGCWSPDECFPEESKDKAENWANSSERYLAARRPSGCGSSPTTSFPGLQRNDCPAGASGALVQAEECGRGIAHTHAEHTCPPPSTSPPPAPHQAEQLAQAAWPPARKVGPARQDCWLRERRVVPDRLPRRTWRKEGKTGSEWPPSPRALLAGHGRAT